MLIILTINVKLKVLSKILTFFTKNFGFFSSQFLTCQLKKNFFIILRHWPLSQKFDISSLFWLNQSKFWLLSQNFAKKKSAFYGKMRWNLLRVPSFVRSRNPETLWCFIFHSFRKTLCSFSYLFIATYFHEGVSLPHTHPWVPLPVDASRVGPSCLLLLSNAAVVMTNQVTWPQGVSWEFLMSYKELQQRCTVILKAGGFFSVASDSGKSLKINSWSQDSVYQRRKWRVWCLQFILKSRRFSSYQGDRLQFKGDDAEKKSAKKKKTFVKCLHNIWFEHRDIKIIDYDSKKSHLTFKLQYFNHSTNCFAFPSSPWLFFLTENEISLLFKFYLF